MVDLKQLVKDRCAGTVTDKAIPKCYPDWELPAALPRGSKKLGDEAEAEQKELHVASQTWAQQEPAAHQPETRLVWSKEETDLSEERHPFQTEGPFPQDDAGEYYLDGELRRNAVGAEVAHYDSTCTWTLEYIIGKHSNVVNILAFADDKKDLDWAFEAKIMPPQHEVLTVICQPGFQNTTVSAYGVKSVTSSRKGVKQIAGQMNMAFMWIQYWKVATDTDHWVLVQARLALLTYVQDFLPTPPIPKASVTFGEDLIEQFNMVFVRTGFYKTIDKGPLSDHLELWDDFNYTNESCFRTAMRQYDLSRVKFRVVVSLPGFYFGEHESGELGSGRLRTVIAEEGWVPREGSTASVAYKTSTLGKYRLAWLKDFYGKCTGLSKDELPSEIPFTILYPSVASIPEGHTVAELSCMCGCFGFNRVTRPFFRDVQPKRPNLIEAKIISAIFEDVIAGDRDDDAVPACPSGSVSGWMYVGSHSLYASAWGVYWQKNIGAGVKKQTRAKIFNFDIGIVFPLSSDPEVAASQARNLVPCQLPGGKYREDDIPFDLGHLAMS